MDFPRCSSAVICCNYLALELSKQNSHRHALQLLWPKEENMGNSSLNQVRKIDSSFKLFFFNQVVF